MKWGPEAELELRRWAEIDERGAKDSCMTAALERIKELEVAVAERDAMLATPGVDDVMGKIYLQCYQALGECQKDAKGRVQPPSPGPPLHIRIQKLVASVSLADDLLIEGRPMGAFGTDIDEWERQRVRYVRERTPKVGT